MQAGAIRVIGWVDDQELRRKHPNVTIVGSDNEVMLPGFVNGHHHIGLTPVQLGSPDMPLELWFVTRMVMRNVDLYLDTLYSAFEMIASGVTTVQHLHGRRASRPRLRRSHSRLPGCWDAGLLLVCGARSEPAGLPAGGRLRREVCRPNCGTPCSDGSNVFN
jgi:cytosine/adenosine deaminase-related metal-dependent hydrolase